MDIYSNDSDAVFFDTPYTAKRLLDDSIARTLRGGHELRNRAVLKGSGNILLGRVQSVVAFAMVTLASAFLMIPSVFFAPCFLAPATALNLASRLPGISSYHSVQKFTKSSSQVILRTLRVIAIALPVIFTFLTASSVNTCLPGILKPQNVFARAIHHLVKPLGDLKTIRAVVPGVTKVTGQKETLSALGAFEEFFRAFSSKNYIKEVQVQHLVHHYTFSMPR